jgi:hypothetical protein
VAARDPPREEKAGIRSFLITQSIEQPFIFLKEANQRRHGGPILIGIRSTRGFRLNSSPPSPSKAEQNSTHGDLLLRNLPMIAAALSRPHVLGVRDCYSLSPARSVIKLSKCLAHSSLSLHTRTSVQWPKSSFSDYLRQATQLIKRRATGIAMSGD